MRFALVQLTAFAPPFALAFSLDAQGAACPDTQFNCRGTTQTVPGDRGEFSCPYSDYDGSYGSAAFDYPLGTARLSFANTSLELAVADSFWFEGLAPGDSVRCRANLILSGLVGGGDFARFDVTFSLTPGQTQEKTFWASRTGPPAFDGALDQWLGLRIGEFFITRLTLRGVDAAGGGGDIYAVLQFSELPPNVVVRSCHGFRQDGPVPARHSSWGSIKANYR